MIFLSDNSGISKEVTVKKVMFAFIISAFLISCAQKDKLVKKEPIEDMGNIITVDSTTLLSMAQDHYNKEEYTQCGDLLETILDREPENYKARLLKGRLLTSLGDYESALSLLHGLEKEYPRKYDVHYYLGRVYEAQKFNTAALKYYMNSYELGNTNSYLVEKIAILFMREQKFSEAISFFHNYLVRHDKHHYIRYQLAMAYFYTNNYNYAIDQLKLLQRYDAGYSLSYYGLGYIYFEIYERSQNPSYKRLSHENLKHYLTLEPGEGYYSRRARSMMSRLE